MTTLDQTVKQVSGRQAASAMPIPSGTGTAWLSCVATYSAYPPPGNRAQTLSPICQRVTPGPIATTVPDASSPGRGDALAGGA